MTSPTLTLAAAQYEVGFIKSWQVYESKIAAQVNDAVKNGANMLLFPEYFSMELASLLGEAVYSKLDKQLLGLQELLPDFLKLFAKLSQQHGIFIQAGSFPVKVGAEYRNRAFLFGADGNMDFQDKLTMTRFEREQWGISAGSDIKIFNTPFAPIAISVCYDVEFPLIARKQAEMGAMLILAPSCTDTHHGYHRVRIGAAARAMENQIYTAQACTIGACPWSPAIDINVGAAGIFTPVDKGFPEDGVSAAGELNKSGCVYSTLDFTKINECRSDGQNFNFKDWKKV